MVRAIDASRFGEIMEQWKKDCLECDDQYGADVISDVILQLDDMPTLTPPTEWVRVKDRLPEECADILLCRKILKIPEIGTYRQARFWVYDEIGDVYQVDDITHWMPIPTLYDIDHIHISEPPEG